MPMVEGKSVSPDEAMLLGLCPECGAKLVPRTARSHAQNHWGSDPDAAHLSEEGKRRFKLILDFAANRGGRLPSGATPDSRESSTAAEQNERATEYVGTALLAMLAVPFFEEGTRAAFDGHKFRAAVAYILGAIPAIAGFFTVANYWPRLRTNLGMWINRQMAPIATNPIWWFAVSLFVLLWVAWPELLTKFHESNGNTSAILQTRATEVEATMPSPVPPHESSVDQFNRGAGPWQICAQQIRDYSGNEHTVSILAVEGSHTFADRLVSCLRDVGNWTVVEHGRPRAFIGSPTSYALDDGITIRAKDGSADAVIIQMVLVAGGISVNRVAILANDPSVPSYPVVEIGNLKP